MQLQITPVSRVHDIVPLLAACNLPGSDITNPAARFFTVHDQATLLGVVGLELYGSEALLRSLAVVEEQRRHGLGSQLLEFAEQQARAAGANKVYLLTTNATDYFYRHGYRPVDRTSAPESIRNTSQFRGVCPASAHLLGKTLASQAN